ncbi:hypothetical protein FPZ43_04555 [Mucilaginibacter pallidiroseus]|uniref:Uncharacterized protein n=1 Tax=Mucilaginibacter pallidiroseus TaxID=2599295 RepID=A0A563UG28_9SPHI|nr:hypothetical protein [Mucilaginibacter pallidiroseus]TWR30219.1 hypothetical protein FPZ43_04555 [Mucilaginibacter pallidiroseus]
MEPNEITLTNTLSKKLYLSLEPEGTLLELLPGENIKVELFAASGRIIDLQISEYKGRFCLALWPDKGSYNIDW